jgi:hypothetical protein
MSTTASSRRATPQPATQGSPNLRTILDQKRAGGRPMTLEEAIAIVVPLCMDLKERHDRGEAIFVHPSCIAPDKEGLAKLQPRLAKAPVNPRDRACVAPELQATGKPGGAKASVFSVGAILYEALTSYSVGPAMLRPREVDPNLPQALEVLLSKALVGDPQHRPDDLGALASAMHHLAPMKSIHPPDVDTSTLDKTGDFQVDVRMSLLPPEEMVPDIKKLSKAPAVPLEARDPYGHVTDKTAAEPRQDAAQVLVQLKARLEADPRPRYVVNKEKMDHGPFTAVELLQQIASHQFRSEDGLRDELSGQQMQIQDWAEFAPFAQHAKMQRELVAEKKEVAKVEKAEKKSGFAKVAVSIIALAAIVAGAGWWFFQHRGSRSDDIAVEGDETSGVDGVGGIKGQKRAGGGGRGGGRGGAGGFVPGGMSYEAALNSNNQTIVMGQNAGPDLTNGQLEAPLKNGAFIGGCGAPNSMKVTVRVAIKMGRAVGVSVYTDPADGPVATCIDHAVRGLSWPANPKMDFVTTRY